MDFEKAKFTDRLLLIGMQDRTENAGRYKRTKNYGIWLGLISGVLGTLAVQGITGHLL